VHGERRGRGPRGLGWRRCLAAPNGGGRSQLRGGRSQRCARGGVGPERLWCRNGRRLRLRTGSGVSGSRGESRPPRRLGGPGRGVPARRPARGRRKRRARRPFLGRHRRRNLEGILRFADSLPATRGKHRDERRRMRARGRARRQAAEVARHGHERPRRAISVSARPTSARLSVRDSERISPRPHPYAVASRCTSDARRFLSWMMALSR